MSNDSIVSNKDSIVCPCCLVDRPADEIMLVDKQRDLWRCRICIMLNKTHDRPGKAFIPKKPEIKKVPKPKVIKERPPYKVCPGCLKTLSIDQYDSMSIEDFRFCNTCRQDNILLNDERNKRLLGPLFASGISVIVGKCDNCGFMDDLVKNFKLDRKTPTGYSRYCTKRCDSKRK